MAKRIQMRKQRFNAVQKMAAEKKIVHIESGPGPSVPEPLPTPRTSTHTRPTPPSRSSVYFMIFGNLKSTFH